MIEHLESSPKFNISSYKSNQQIFVLWAPQFESAPASIFVAKLRELGLRVKVVSLSVRKMPGKNGVAIYYDMTLGEALTMTNSTSGVIVPCGLMGAQRLRNDPRAYRFFKEVSANKVPIIIGYMEKSHLERLRLFPLDTIDDLIMYPEIEDLMEFINHLATSFWIRPKNEI